MVSRYAAESNRLTAFKTISMRIRGAKTELEEAGLDTENMASSTAKLREEILALSGVDIMEDENTFKSTYQIMDELATKWGELTDIQQASITELIAGKRQGNIVSSLMENFDEARKALEVSMNSEGSAMTEHEKWLDSIEAKQLQLKASWEGLSQDFLTSDFLKDGIDALRGVVNGVDAVVDTIGSLGTVASGAGLWGIKKLIGKAGLSGLLSVVTALPTPLLATAAAVTAVGVGAYAAKRHFDKLETGEYLVEDAEKIKEYADNITELNGLRAEVNSLELVITSPESSQAEIEAAKQRLQEIADLVNQEYHLNISANTDELDHALKLLTADERYDMLGEVDRYTEELKGYKDDYRSAINNLDSTQQKNDRLNRAYELVEQAQDAWALASSNSDPYIRESEQIKAVRKIKKLYDEAHDELDSLGEEYANLIGTGSDRKFDMDLESISDKLNEDGAELSKYNELIENVSESSSNVANSLAEVLASDVQQGDGYAIENEIKRFEQAGTALREMGAETDTLSQMFAISRTGFLQLNEAIDNGRLDDVVTNYLNIKAAIGETGENAVRGAAMLKQGFSDMSQITPESLTALYDDMKSLGEQKGLSDSISNAVEGTSLLAAGFRTVKEAADAGDEGIAKVLTNMSKLKEHEGIFTDDMDISERASQLTKEARAIGLLPDNKVVKIDAETGELSAVTDFTDKILSTWGGGQVLNIGVNTDVDTKTIDDFSAKVDALNNKDCYITFNADGTPARAVIDDVEYDLTDYDASEGTAILKAEGGEAIGTIDLVNGKIELLPKTTNLIITTTAEGVTDGIQNYIDFIESVNDQTLQVGLKFEIDDAGNVSILDRAGNLLNTIEKGENIAFHITAEGDLEVLNTLTGQLRTFDKYGNITLPVEAQVKNMGEVQGFTGELESLNGQSCSVILNADEEPLVGKIGEATYMVDNYSDETGTATLYAESGEAIATIDLVNNEITALPNDKDINLSATGNDNGASEVKDTVDQTNSKDVDLSATGVDNGASGVKFTIDSTNDKGVQLTATASDNGVSGVKFTIDNTNSKGVTVNATGIDNGASGIKFTIDNTHSKAVTLIANAIDNGVSRIKSLWDSIRSKAVTLTTTVVNTTRNIVQTVRTGVTNLFGGSEADGTAHAKGTAFSKGAAGKAFKSGDWGTKTSGVALGGELGEELVVRDGKFFTIGSDSAEFFSYKKGDIIFNAEQTKQIFEKGKITHGKRRGQALYTGTAFADGSESKEDFDWIEIFSDRVERNITRFTNRFESSYLTLVNRFINLGNAITETQNQIRFKQQAYDRYIEQANAVGLDESWAAKVRDGEFDISTVTDDDLKEKIKDYQEWYEKALDCKDAIDELHESIADFYKDNFDNIANAYDNILTSIEHRANELNNYIDRAEERGLLGSTRYYEALQISEKKNLEQLKYEQTDLINALNDAINSGEIEVYSDTWYELQNSIDEVTEAIQESETALIAFDNQMRQVLWDRFDYLQDNISNFVSEAEFLIDLLGEDNLYDENGELNDRGLSVLGLHGANYNTYMAQSAAYAEEIAKIESEIAENRGDDNLVQRRQELLGLQRESILAANDEKEAMIDLVKDGIEEQVDALKELIDAYTDSLDSAKD